MQAQAECGALQEGGVAQGTWSLPHHSVYDGLDANMNVTNPNEGVFWCGTWNGNSCDDMPDQAASMWLFEEDPNDNTKAYIIFGNALGSIASTSKGQNTAPFSFICVK